MNNKGFTLVELLGVIVILILIFILVIPSVTKVISTSKDTIYQKQINTILTASYDWSLKNITKLPEEGNKIFITLSDLIVMGLIEGEIVDQKTNEPFANNLVISITNVGSNYQNNDDNTILEGDYLYKLELDMMSSQEFEDNKPSIELDGDLVTKVNLNSDFSSIEYTARSNIDNEYLKDKVSIFIIFSDKIVSEVDTSKIGIYHVNYTVIDKNGYSNTITRKVIISDISEPILTIPEETTIERGTTYDLLSDITCEDNSNYCDITIIGEVDFTNTGSYIIEYIAKDPSGNTKTAERVITVE